MIRKLEDVILAEHPEAMQAVVERDESGLHLITIYTKEPRGLEDREALARKYYNASFVWLPFIVRRRVRVGFLFG